MAKSLANTLWLQLNKKNEPLKYSLKRAKTQQPFRNTPSEAPRRSSGGLHSKFFVDKRYGKLRQKVFDRNSQPVTERSSVFQGKHKGNLLQHVFSTYNSNRRSEECSFMGKMLVLCKNSSKLATSRKVKAFFGSMEDTYNGCRNFRNCKGVQNNFSKKLNIGESSPDTTHGSGSFNTSGDREHIEKGSHTANKTSDWGVFKQYFFGIVIYLDHMLITGQRMEETLMSRDSVIFLQQHLGFVLNLKKFILNLVQKIEFLGITINSLKMCLSLSQEVLKIQSQCQDIHTKSHVTVLKLTKFCLNNPGSFANSH